MLYSTMNAQGIIVNLWEGLTDQADSIKYNDGIKLLSHIENPTIEVFLPAGINKKAPAVIICPGGGYGFLAYDWEGTQIAQWLNEHDIIGIVLKYRLPKPQTGALTTGRIRSMDDVQRAMNVTLENADNWQINPSQIGIMGFSAGGHLASYSSNSPSPPTGSHKFAFSVLVYPVISMADKITNDWTRQNLLGKPNQDYEQGLRDDLLNQYSTQNLVSKHTPPTFIVHSNDDDAVPVENSLLYYDKLREHNIPVEIHLFPSGGHGYSLFKPGETELGWGALCINWIKSLSEQ